MVERLICNEEVAGSNPAGSTLMNSPMNMESYNIILFYKFIEIKDPHKLMREQKEICAALNLKGRMLIAEEGINGTFEGKTGDIEKYKNKLRENILFEDVVFKESAGTGAAFTKLEIKVRKEVVTLDAGKFDIRNETAAEITAEELEALYESKEDFVVLDLRNDFEINAGYFERTVNPNLKNFRDLPAKVAGLGHLKEKKVIAVCTGGIRCEKATCLLKKEGFKDLYQLKDGIHTYMQKYPGRRFKGSLFVFDNRLTTPIADIPGREIVGKCFYCGNQCEDFYSDDSVRPSLKVICCPECVKSRLKELRKCA